VSDSHDPAGFRAALVLFHQMIIVSPGSVLRRVTRAPPRSLNLCRLQGLITQASQRALDVEPTKWLTFRPALPDGTGLSARAVEIPEGAWSQRVEEGRLWTTWDLMVRRTGESTAVRNAAAAGLRSHDLPRPA
jgi:hypothetical protein